MWSEKTKVILNPRAGFAVDTGKSEHGIININYAAVPPLPGLLGLEEAHVPTFWLLRYLAARPSWSVIRAYSYSLA